MAFLKRILKSALGAAGIGLIRRAKWTLRPPERELRWLVKIIRHVGLRGSFIDIGAHLGMYSVLTAGSFEHVIGIEANPDLCKDWMATGLAKNIVIENIA